MEMNKRDNRLPDDFSEKFFSEHPEKRPMGPTVSNKIEPTVLAQNIQNHNQAVVEKFLYWEQRIANGHKE